MKNFTNKSCYAKKIFILKIFFRGRGVPPSVSRRLLISPDFPLRFFRGTAGTFWRARGFEILRVYSFPEIIVLDLTNFLQNDRSSLISWLFSTKNYSYFTSSLFSVNFFSDGYMDHTKNPFWNYSFKFSSQHSCFVLCSTNSVALGRKSVAKKERLTRWKWP